MAPSLPSLFSKSGYGVTLGFFLYNLPVKRELKAIEMGKMAELASRQKAQGCHGKLRSLYYCLGPPLLHKALGLDNMSFMDSRLFC